MNIMTELETTEKTRHTLLIRHNEMLQRAVKQSWSKISPFWPLRNLIAVNPLAGFENLSFEDGLKQAQAFFQQREIPKGMERVNQHSIKWLQAFFDDGQSTIHLPNRHLGFLKCTLSLIKFDKKCHKNDAQKLQWLQTYPSDPMSIIAQVLTMLDIEIHEHALFLTLMLTTLSGWASYIQYRINWADEKDGHGPFSVTELEYLAFRVVLTWLVWPEAKKLISWHKKAVAHTNINYTVNQILTEEKTFQKKLLTKLRESATPKQVSRPKAQFVFCIDVRSEPFRRALESQGDYDTYGFAGFFGIPVTISNAITNECYESCPVLLKPAHTVIEMPNSSHPSWQNGHHRRQELKKLYQSVKYTFTTPFNLVEAIGLWNGLWMVLKSLSPITAKKIRYHLNKIIAPDYDLTPDIQTIPFSEQLRYGSSALKTIGLTSNFSSVVMLCGHVSATQNNAYATALHCGACGGHQGAPNARILAEILNTHDVRKALEKEDIVIPNDTQFIAAQHNTTTDEVEIYINSTGNQHAGLISEIKNDLHKARIKNNQWRAQKMGLKIDDNHVIKDIAARAEDWAQIRPEWGLAGNAAFIIAPRSLIKHIDFEGQTFLHSYEWKNDENGNSLTTILTAPMIVAQWINAQYLFSTLDNVAFGGGSKVTQNITGKIGIMQGNGSDLMHGLALQSLYQSDCKAYHKPIRLSVIVYAPMTMIDRIIEEQAILQTLFGNGWVHLFCYDPMAKQYNALQRDLTWRNL